MLISIVSKPIKGLVVVVVIVVVANKNFVQTNFDPKTIHAHKTLSLKLLYPKKFGSNKM